MNKVKILLTLGCPWLLTLQDENGWIQLRVMPTLGGGNATCAAPLQTEPTRSLRWKCSIEVLRKNRAAGAVLRALYCTVVPKRDLSRKAKLSIDLLIFVPSLTVGHAGWVMIERTRSQVQVAWNLNHLWFISGPWNMAISYQYLKKSRSRWFKTQVFCFFCHMILSICSPASSVGRAWDS